MEPTSGNLLTTADWALVVSILSAMLSLFALFWNVAQTYIFVKPRVQVSFATFTSFQSVAGSDTLQPGKKLLSINATNLGPGPVKIHSCVVKTGVWPQQKFGILNPIEGDPLAPVPRSSGPFSGGLPARIEPGEVKSFYFPYDKDCLLAHGAGLVGVHDTYGTSHWCRWRDYKRALRSYRADFGEQRVSETA